MILKPTPHASPHEDTHEDTHEASENSSFWSPGRTNAEIFFANDLSYEEKIKQGDYFPQTSETLQRILPIEGNQWKKFLCSHLKMSPH